MKYFWSLCLLGTLLLAEGTVLYSFDFSKQPSGNAEKILKPKGFEFLLDADKLNMKLQNGRLEFWTDGQYAGLFGIHFKKPMPNVGYVVIEWGVEKFPQGADWEKGKNRLAVGALIALGTEKFSSGVPFAKKAPYFFGPFIGEKEKVGKRYLGKLYKKSGRYYCVSNKKGLIKTRFDIDQKFKQEFGKTTPPLVAYGFQMNTKDTTGGAKAFVKKITFYSK
jgi:hypothetical protein